MTEAPHNIEAEQQVLGAVLLDGERIGAVEATGGADLFYEPTHVAIYEAAKGRRSLGQQVSPITVKGALEDHEGLKELGGPGYLARLAGSAIAPDSIGSYTQILAEARMRREALTHLSEAQGALTEQREPPDAVLARLEAAVAVLGDKGRSKAPVSLMKAVTGVVETAVAAHNGEPLPVVASGILALDRIIAGFERGHLILLAGRPSMGKTGVALSVASAAARAGHGVVIASLEMTPEAMASRLISQQTANNKQGVAFSTMRGERLDAVQLEQIGRAANDISTLPIQFLPRDYADLDAMLAGTRQALRHLPSDKIPLVIVDYAQLLKSKAKSRYEQITEISIALKGLAMRLNCPVLALSQLSRAVEQRDDKRPMLSDLRESGQLEQDADAVIFCYRDEYYLERDKPNEASLDDMAAWREAMSRSHRRLELIVAKQRQGPIGTAHVRFNPALNLIWEDGR